MAVKRIIPQTLKGFRDFLPSEKILRDEVIQRIKTVFEKYGFDPLETPALEYGETLLEKYGEEADRLIYLFNDRGGREIGLRYDQTVPLARVVAQYPNLPKPFKRYQIGPVWRAENPQKGRFREFLQCDIDIVGETSVMADAEIIACALETIKNLGITKAYMGINDREIFNNIDKKILISLDKLTKIGEEGVVKDLEKKGLKKSEAIEIINKIKKAKPSERLIKIFSLLKNNGLKENSDFIFQPTLARGLDYYTSTIFELITPNYSAGSLGGGGRYDQLIGLFSGKNESAVGFAFGFDRLIEAIKELSLLEKFQTKTKVLVTVFNQNLFEDSLMLTKQLRDNGINTEVYLNEQKKIDKQLKYADRKGIEYAIILGPEEKRRGIVKVKNLKKREQREIDLKEIIHYLGSQGKTS